MSTSPAPSATNAHFPDSPQAGNAALVVIALILSAATVTYLGPVLQPFLIAVFLFYAIRFGVKSLTNLGLSSLTAHTALIGAFWIGSILLVQFVYRESMLFQKTWPKYEDRIAAFIVAWSPSKAPIPAPPVSEQQDLSRDRHFPPFSSPKAKIQSSATSPPLAEHSNSDSSGPTLKPEDSLPEETPDLIITQEEKAQSEATVDTAETDVPSSTIAQASSESSEKTVSPQLSSKNTAELPARTSLTELFRLSSQDVINYVFSHGFDVMELGVLVFFYLVFLMLGSRKLEARVLRAFPGDQGVRLVATAHGISESMERFMVVKTVVGIGMGFAAGLVMYFFGLDHWLLWAFLFFASNYITYIGSMVACIPPMVLAYLDLDSSLAASILASLIVLNRVFWIDFVEIRMSGKQLNLDPTLLFLWLSYWGWAWGVLGLVLAFPMMAAVKISLSHLGNARGWALLLSDE